MNLSIKVDVSLSGARVELTAGQKAEVAKYIQSLLLERTPREPKAKKARHGRGRSLFPHRGWDAESKSNLVHAYHEVKDKYPTRNEVMKDLAQKFVRTPSAVYAKLNVLGILKS